MNRKLLTRDGMPAAPLYRPVELDMRRINVAERSVPAILSTDAEVSRFGGTEVLSHEPDAIDLGRATRGLPLLFNHDVNQPIGRVRNVRLDGRQLIGDLTFSQSPEGERRFREVQEGTLADVSVGYLVSKWVSEGKRERAVSWEVFEASVVTVPRDPNAVIHRAYTPPAQGSTPQPHHFPGGIPQPSDGVGAIGLTREMQIAQAFAPYPGHEQLLNRCIMDAAITPVVASQLLMQELATRSMAGAAPGQVFGSGQLSAGEDAADKFRRGMNQCLSVRFNLKPDLGYGQRGGKSKVLDQEGEMLNEGFVSDYTEAMRRRGENPFQGLGVLELGRRWLYDVAGERDAMGWGRDRVVTELLKRAGTTHTPSDFTNLLADNMSKALQVGYIEAPETWQQWCRTGSLPDFKTSRRPVLSTFSDLDTITGDKVYTHGTFSDRQETISLLTKGKMFGISRQALIDDDLSSFSDIPRHMGRAANRMVGDDVYALLTANAALSDSIALFHASHSNLVASGAAPSVAQLNTMLTNFATQTDPASNVLNLAPRFVITPWALWGTTRALMVSEQTPGTANNDRNIWQASLEQVTEARLDADSAVKWYLAAAQGAIDTIEVAFLDGNQAPFLDQQAGWNRDGVEYKVRFDYGTAVLDHRGLALNNGA